MAINATAVRLYVEDGTFVTFDCEQGLTLNINAAPADTTCKNSDFESSQLVKLSGDISVDGILIEGDSGQNVIVADMFNLTATPVKIKTINSEMYSGSINFASFAITAPDKDVVKLSASGKFTGTISKTTAT